MAQLTILTLGESAPEGRQRLYSRIIFPAPACTPISLAQGLIPDKSSETFLRAVQQMLSIILPFVQATCSTKGLPAKRDREAGHRALWLSKKRMHLLTGRCQCWRQAVPFHDSLWRLASMLWIITCYTESVYMGCMCVCRHAINASSMEDDYWCFWSFTIH